MRIIPKDVESHCEETMDIPSIAPLSFGLISIELHLFGHHEMHALLLHSCFFGGCGSGFMGNPMGRGQPGLCNNHIAPQKRVSYLKNHRVLLERF